MRFHNHSFPNPKHTTRLMNTPPICSPEKLHPLVFLSITRIFANMTSETTLRHVDGILAYLG